MADESGTSTTIEVAKTGRARCRICREAIAKGDLRFGEEMPNAFSDSGGTTWGWHHLTCAARKMAPKVKEALTRFVGPVPNQAEIDALLAEGEKKAAAAPAAFPYAERAPTGRSKCLQCEEPIEKGTLRIAVERQLEAMGMSRTGAGYLHPTCAMDYVADDSLLEVVRNNSKGLSSEDLQEIAEQFAR
jgi:poly(ADP-ribose) polymerase-like protein